MFSRYFQPYGLKRRLHVDVRNAFDGARHLRYVEVVDALRNPLPAAERVALLVEKADIDAASGRFDAALAGLDAARTVALASDPEKLRGLDLERGRLRSRAGDHAQAEVDLNAVLAATPDPQRPDLAGRRALLALGRVHLEQGRFALAADVLGAGLAQPQAATAGAGDGQPPETMAVAERLAGLYDLVYAAVREARYAVAEATLADAERLADPEEPVARASLAYYRSWVAFARRRIDVAAALLDDARREFAHQRDDEALSCVDLSRACVEFERADLPACLQRCDQILSAPKALRPDVAGSVLLLRGLTLFVMGRFAEALAEYARAERQAVAVRRTHMICRALHWRADVHAFLGDFDTARLLLQRTLDMNTAAGDRLGIAMALCDLGHVDRRAGNQAAATGHFAAARAEATALGNRWELARIDTEEMEAHFQRGDTAGAERKGHAALQGYELLGDHVRLSRVVKHMAQVAALRDDFDAAEGLYDRALSLIAEEPNRILRAEILDSRAEARADAGRVDAALRDLVEAQSLVEPTGAVHLANALAAHAAQVRERHAAQAILSQYMEPKIVSRLLSRGPRRLAGNVVQEATILFSDIRGFTDMTERRGPQEVVELLNEHFEAMTEEIVACGGTIDKFIGDAIMAVFGDPGRPRPDDAERCVQAGVAMVQRRAELNAVRRQLGLEAIEIGVGIGTGDVVMGNIGSARRLTYTVIGDAVNVAARLEGLTKAYGERVLISGQTRARLAPAFGALPLGEVEVKGRTRRVDVFAVRCTATDDAATAFTGAAPLAAAPRSFARDLADQG